MAIKGRRNPKHDARAGAEPTSPSQGGLAPGKRTRTQRRVRGGAKTPGAGASRRGAADAAPAAEGEVGRDLLAGERGPTRAELLGEAGREEEGETLVERIRSRFDSEPEPGERSPDELVQDGVLEEGERDHTSAEDADAAIQEELAMYVGGAVEDGRQIAGMVAVVGDADWETVGLNQYGEDRWEDRRDRINAFVDRDGRVFVHKDRGNAGTMVHEACHKYSTRDLIQVSQPLNEAVTEYFTRLVCERADIDISGRGNYQANYDCATELVAMVGEATVAASYFDGDTDGLRSAFREARDRLRDRDDNLLTRMKSRAEWNTFVEATSANEWDEATALCEGEPLETPDDDEPPDPPWG